jgi:hypothetical protein
VIATIGGMVMRKIVGDAIDFGLICILLVYYYFDAFEKAPAWSQATTDHLRLILAVIAIFVLPFRLRRHKKLHHFFAYNRDGRPRRVYIVPAVTVAGVFIATLYCIRVIVLIFNFNGG